MNMNKIFQLSTILLFGATSLACSGTNKEESSTSSNDIAPLTREVNKEENIQRNVELKDEIAEVISSEEEVAETAPTATTATKSVKVKDTKAVEKVSNDFAKPVNTETCRNEGTNRTKDGFGKSCGFQMST